MEPKVPEILANSSVASTREVEDHFFSEAVSPATRALERLIAEIAPTDIPILLVGESGSGKEVVALRIHRLSARRNAPFSKLICTTLVPEALEQPLGGMPSGLQALADAGTIFLDEICDLDPACQPKLLHVLPDGDAVSNDRCLHARVISSTGRDLEEEIRAGRFREELYYRLNGVCLRLPPLRHRREDIPPLIDFFLMKYSAQFGRPKPAFSSHMLEKLVNYSWPGNVRQLENAMKNIVALGDERCALGNLEALAAEPRPQPAASERFSLKQAARAASWQAERELILKALARTHWNRKRAAKELQISYKALLYKLKQIGIEDSENSFHPRGEGE